MPAMAMDAVGLKPPAPRAATGGGIGLGNLLGSTAAASVLALTLTWGCNRGPQPDLDAGVFADLQPHRLDLSTPRDLRSEPEDLSATDLARSDLAAADLALPGDLASPPDLTAPPDLAVPDLAVPPDLTTPRDLAVPPDLTTPRPACKRGTGWAAWRFKYDGSSSARLEAFGLPDSSNWEAVPARAASYSDGLHGGGLEIGGGNWILIRFSLVGLSHINSATLSVFGRSYSTGSSGSYEAWSPIYGSISAPTNSVSNAWPYTWTSVDYTANVNVGDPPGLTGIRLYAGPSSNDLIINTVELCIDGY